MQFPSVKDLALHMRQAHAKHGTTDQIADAKQQVVPQPPPEEIKPLVLAYKWIGRCNTCGREVDTITVELTEKQAIVAYCGNCHTQKAEQKVIPISKQK